MNKLFLVGVLIMVACGGLFLAGFDDSKIEDKNKDDINLEEQIYQGPVPQGYNVDHFRKTGETIMEEID